MNIRCYGKYDKKWSPATVKSRLGSNVYICQLINGSSKKLHADQISKRYSVLPEEEDYEYDEDDMFRGGVSEGLLTRPMTREQRHSLGATNIKRVVMNEGVPDVGAVNEMQARGDNSTTRSGRISRPPERYAPN